MAQRTGLIRFAVTASALSALIALTVLATAPGVWAQDGAPPADETELKEAMHRFFEKRVRAELQLTDEQMEHIVPRVRASEELRAEARRERQATVRRLQRGLHEGAGDARLQTLLDELEAIEVRQQRREREILAEIDTVLSVRQRVQFRFFTQRFRAELQRRIREQREGGAMRPFDRRRRP